MFTGFVSLFKFIQPCRTLTSEVLIADAIQSTDLHVGSVDGGRKQILRRVVLLSPLNNSLTAPSLNIPQLIISKLTIPLLTPPSVPLTPLFIMGKKKLKKSI